LLVVLNSVRGRISPSRIPPGSLPFAGLSQSSDAHGSFGMSAEGAASESEWPMILNALVEQLKRWSKDDFKGRRHKVVYPTVTAPCYTGACHTEVEFGIL